MGDMMIIKLAIIEWTIRDLYNRLDTIDLETEYQRQVIWDSDKKAKLIDSVLNDIDIPKIYLAEFSDGHFECIDGKQRISAISEFLSDKLVITPPHSSIPKRFSELDGNLKQKINDYRLTISKIYEPDEKYLRLLFQRLQLGIQLNGGEELHAMLGEMRNCVFKELGGDADFLKRVNIRKRIRYNAELILAQITLTIFSKIKNNDQMRFYRVRLDDLKAFFEKYAHMTNDDKKIMDEIKNTLKVLDHAFGSSAVVINSSAAVLSAYLYADYLISNNKRAQIEKFAEFYVKLLSRISQESKKQNEYIQIDNKAILQEFQKYLMQASAEPKSIKFRHEFLDKAFKQYLKNGSIYGDK